MALAVTIRVFLLLQIVLSLANGKLLSMSHLYDNETITWGTFTQFQHKLVREGRLNENVSYYLSYDLRLNEHAGTHMDAPIHFSKGKWSVDQIPLENLIGEGIVVNMSAKASNDRNAQLTVRDLQIWEENNGRIPDDSLLFVFTGWCNFWPNYEMYMGTKSNDSTLYRFPGIDGDAAQWLVDNRKIKGVGIDTASIDYGKSTTYPSHRIFYRNNIYGLENVANVDKLPSKGATIYVMPMNIKRGSGAPTRIVADIRSYTNRIVPSVILFLLLSLAAISLM